ncbi:MAG: LCP family protein [Chloroflexota bacterium]
MTISDSPSAPQRKPIRRRLAFLALCILASLACLVVFALNATSRIEIPAAKTIDEASLSSALQTAMPMAATTTADARALPSSASAAQPTVTLTATPIPPTPSGPTATPTVTPTPTPRPTPRPPAADIPWPKTLNIVLLGTDKRPTDSSWRTDTMIIVAIEPETKQIGVIAVPRDMWITLPHYANRINTLDFVGGPEFVKQALQYEFGIPIHYYARVKFDGFVRAVDAVGGITVDVECRVSESGNELGEVDIPSGPVPMDGQLALTFARSRLTTSDFDRMRRQQAVLLAFRKRLLSADMLPRLPEVVPALSQLAQTDIPPQTLLSLARLGVEIDLRNVHAFLLDERVMRGVTTAGGASVQKPDEALVQSGLQDIWNGQPLTEAIKRPKGWACK